LPPCNPAVKNCCLLACVANYGYGYAHAAEMRYTSLTCAAAGGLPYVHIIAASCVPGACCASCCVAWRLACLADSCASTGGCPAAAVGRVVGWGICTDVSCSKDM
jgi:hypothetical protein